MHSGLHRNLFIVALLASPIVFVSIHLGAYHRYDLPSAALPWALLAGVVAGSIGVWRIPTGRRTRLAALLVYIPTAVLAAYAWAFLLACGAYGACL